MENNEILYSDSLKIANEILNNFCKAYNLPLLEENNGEIQDLTKEQIAVLLTQIPGYSGRFNFAEEVTIPAILNKQNTENKWWLRQVALMIHEYRRLGWYDYIQRL